MSENLAYLLRPDDDKVTFVRLPAGRGKTPQKITLHLRCPQHPTYKGVRKPYRDCPSCWGLYWLRHPEEG